MKTSWCKNAALLAFAGALFVNGRSALVNAAEPVRDAAGFVRFEGQHLSLVTDLPSAPALEALPAVFDQAVDQWCAYFGVDPATLGQWHVTGYLMSAEDRFRTAGYLPANLPPFLHGYQTGLSFWIREQPSEYYRRHLMIHEGTHAFMHQVLQRNGPGWYQEGLAEVLATHRWDGQQLQLNVLPARKEDVPDWGRIRLIREAVKAGKTRNLREVMELTGREFQAVEGYAWSWAAAVFLDGHPRWSSQFRRWANVAVGPTVKDFNAQAWRELQTVEAPIEEAWQLFLHELDYGYAVAADAIRFQPPNPPTVLTPGQSLGGWRTQIDSDAGWQATGILLEANRAYNVTSTGRYQVVLADPPWQSEADGITLQYCGGRPLGQLLGAVRATGLTEGPGAPDAAGSGDPISPLVRPLGLGSNARLTPTQPGELYLRINESAGQRHDNRGKLTVEVTPVRSTDPSQPD